MPTHGYPETSLTFTGRTHEYGNVYTYSFTSVEPVSYSAGQYGHLRLPGMPEEMRAVREFSFVSAPFESDIRFGIDAVSGSPYQKRLLELEAGDAVALFKIKGHMTWPPPDVSRIVMIGGGVGVTPFRSMLVDKRKRNITLPVTLLHISREHFLYESELRALADEYITAGRESLEHALNALIERRPDAHFYVAGSPGFTERVVAMLKSGTISRVEADSFKGLSEEL